MATIINAGTTALTVTPDATGALTIQANGTSALAITANGQITTANAPFILTGGRLQFPSTAILSGDANCLDDYEEGTWSSTVDNGSNLSGTGTLDQTLYTKVGRLVTVSGRITGVTVINSGATTYPVVTLPFAMTTNSTAVCGPV